MQMKGCYRLPFFVRLFQQSVFDWHFLSILAPTGGTVFLTAHSRLHFSSSSIWQSSSALHKVPVQVQRYLRDLYGDARSSLRFPEKSPHLILRVVFLRKTLHPLVPTFSMAPETGTYRSGRKTHIKQCRRTE